MIFDKRSCTLLLLLCTIIGCLENNDIDFESAAKIVINSQGYNSPECLAALSKFKNLDKLDRIKGYSGIILLINDPAWHEFALQLLSKYPAKYKALIFTGIISNNALQKEGCFKSLSHICLPNDELMSIAADILNKDDSEDVRLTSYMVSFQNNTTINLPSDVIQYGLKSDQGRIYILHYIEMHGKYNELITYIENNRDKDTIAGLGGIVQLFSDEIVDQYRSALIGNKMEMPVLISSLVLRMNKCNDRNYSYCVNQLKLNRKYNEIIDILEYQIDNDCSFKKDRAQKHLNQLVDYLKEIINQLK